MTTNKENNVDGHLLGELKQKQSLPLDAKIQMTKRRIREWYEAFDRKVYISFSGGKDSTVLLHIARQVYPDIPAVFCDTGLEYPEIRMFVKATPGVTVIRPKMNFRQVIQTYGYPVISKRVAGYVSTAKKSPNSVRAKYLYGEIKSKFVAGNGKYAYLVDAPFLISDYCCNVMKKSPLKKYQKETGSRPILATMAQESTSRHEAWMKYGCNAFGAKDPKSTPMSFWMEQDVLRYLKEYSVPYCSVYGEILEDKDGKLHTTGCTRTGCMFCMFGVHREKSPNRFERMKETHPQIYEYCMKPVEENGLGLDKVLNFLNVPH